MAVRNTANIVGYGLTDALTRVFPSPIVSSRAPTANDTAQIGQVWIDKPDNQVYVLTSVVANVATWVSSAGGGGIFSSLSVSPGPISLEGTTTINTTSTDNTTIGNFTGDVQIGGADIDIEGASVTINLTNTGNTSIGNTTGSVNITGENTTVTAATTLLLDSTADVNISGAIIDIESAQVTINVNNSGNASIGNSTGTFSATGSTVDITGLVGINNSGADSTFINSLGTGDVSIGNLTGTTDISGSALGISGPAVNINTIGVGNTGIGNSVGNTDLTGATVGLESPLLTLNSVGTGNTSIGNLTGTVNITGSSIFIDEFKFSGGPAFLFGSGSPSGSITATQGSLYLNTAGSGVNDRAFINTDGATAWTAIVTVA